MRALELGASARYEHRRYFDDSRLSGPLVPPPVTELSEKRRIDDRYTLATRARYRLGGRPELGVFLAYAFRLSRSNVAFQTGDLEYAFDYDNRNFTQHTVEVGVDARY